MLECIKCVNSTANPTISINQQGLCNICALYKEGFSLSRLKEELDFFYSLKSDKILVGVSGGKDSTATLYLTQRMGFRPEAFTFNLGYYPEHIFKRAKDISEKLEVVHNEIDIRKYLRNSDRFSYRETVELYKRADSKEFLHYYALNRKHYSVNSTEVMPFVRSCQICRKTVIRAYYWEAVFRGAKAVVLGMNEWTGLSKSTFSGVRILQPSNLNPPVAIVHLPFLLQHNVFKTAEILKELGWEAPTGEFLVESNANSCLFARATEEKARKLLGFHPDSTRLAREVTVGFITREQAQKALDKQNRCEVGLNELLMKAEVL